MLLATTRQNLQPTYDEDGEVELNAKWSTLDSAHGSPPTDSSLRWRSSSRLITSLTSLESIIEPALLACHTIHPVPAIPRHEGLADISAQQNKRLLESTGCRRILVQFPTAQCGAYGMAIDCRL
jgi:hypothetical protein